ncbi:MAG TPA: hypothetical protein DIW43_05630 [Spongiibacteraceae bacterium]|nr:hypothetical protein [Spongiibacteraceae bacterium]HCS26911.1 hypothetical protein [Spongiibacteraceae bacterium]|tara:strand:+ start:1570 stop:2601 length:1032 start_codon:yes stop_codon:yes gene_type:complete
MKWPHIKTRFTSLCLIFLAALLLMACNSSGPATDGRGLVDPDNHASSTKPSPSPTVRDTSQRCVPEDTGAATDPDCETTGVRALWVWGSAVVLDTNRAQQLFELAEQHALNRIYLAATQALEHDQTALANFFRRAQQLGIHIELLFGQPDWALPENHHYVLSVIDRAGAFAERFPDITVSAIHLDVEPYLLPEWDADRNSLGNAYIDLLESARARSGNLSMPLMADIPVWYDEHRITRNGQPRLLHELVIDATDGVSLMDYRDSSQRIINDASDELAYASLAAKPMVVGVETLCIKPIWITFCEEGSAAMNQILTIIDKDLKRYTAYRGYAIHHLDSFLELAP